MKRVFALLILAASAVLSGGVYGQAFPVRAVKIVVPYPPVGVIDIMARVLAGPMGETLGQTVVVENRSGAGGLMGHDAVAKAAPDGYTLVIAAAGPVAASIKLYKSMPYDPTRDFTPIGMVGDVDVVFVTNPSFAPKSVDQVVQYARENPGQLRFAINSLGSLHHLLTEQFIASNKLEVTRVPYKGAGQAVMDLLAGVTNVQIEGLPAAVAHVRSGKLNALAVASAKRIDALPNTPTFDELGMKGLVAAPWYALLAPAGTPQEIVARLNSELNKALARQSVKEAFAKQGARVIPTTPDEAGRFILSETDRWAKVVTESGVKID